MPSDVRWGTNHRLLESTLRGKNLLLRVVQDPRVRENPSLRNEARRIYELLNDPVFIEKLREAEAVLRPLVTAITAIEGDLVDKGRAYLRVEEAFQTATNEAEQIRELSEVKDEILTVSLIFFNEKLGF